VSKKTNILVCGLYFSGSSAVTDLLNEYEGVGVIPGEFDDVRRAGMIGDSICGKIGPGYPGNLASLMWAGGAWSPQVSLAKRDIFNWIKLIIKVSPLQYIYKRGLYSNLKTWHRMRCLKWVIKALAGATSQSEKLAVGKQYIATVREKFAGGKPYAIFDQPIFLNSHLDIWPEIFSEYKLIVVYRDPRDKIAQLIRNNILYYDIETPTRGLIDIYGDGRLGAIKYEIDTAAARLNNANKLQKLLGNSNVMILSFERLVNDYVEAKTDIERFLALEAASHIRKGLFFDPSLSRNNIGIYKKILTKEELELF
jgi:hypothetical protein